MSPAWRSSILCFPMLDKYELIRSHALGNDYLVVDGASFGVPLTPERVRRICDRHTGVGSDGILELCAPPEGFDAAVRIHNPDGSEAEKSGNGVRIFAKFCVDHGYVDPGRPIRIHTLGGPVVAETIARGAAWSMLRVSMGRVSFRTGDLPMVVPGLSDRDELIGREIVAGDRSVTATCLSIGNPHTVVFDAPFDEASARALGPLLERHVYFPKRTNVQLVRVLDRHRVEALIWERGAGFTQASGSSACAVAAACVRAGLCDREVEVIMPGGSLEVSVGEDWSIEQVGPAQELARGSLSAELVADLLGEPAP